MSRGAQIVIAVLLLAVVGMGVLIVARGRQQQATAPTNRIVAFAPCGLSGPVNVAVAMFRREHPDIKLEVEYDNANVLVRRVRKGEARDLFISPGELEMKQVADGNYIDRGTITTFGSLDIVLFAPSKTKGLTQLGDITKPGIARISMGDPQYNSVGYYGEQALRSMKLWDQVQSKLVLREFPLEAVKLVSEGQVDAGITYLTCPLDTTPEKASKSDLRVVSKFPRGSYPPVRLQVAMFRATNQRAPAQQFIDFLVSEQVQKALSTSGVLPVQEK